MPEHLQGRHAIITSRSEWITVSSPSSSGVIERNAHHPLPLNSPHLRSTLQGCEVGAQLTRPDTRSPEQH